jgi:hypothetical protein
MTRGGFPISGYPAAEGIHAGRKKTTDFHPPQQLV